MTIHLWWRKFDCYLMPATSCLQENALCTIGMRHLGLVVSGDVVCTAIPQSTTKLYVPLGSSGNLIWLLALDPTLTFLVSHWGTNASGSYAASFCEPTPLVAAEALMPKKETMSITMINNAYGHHC